MIDDEPSVRTAISRYFHANGFEVQEAASATSAEDVFRHSLPDIAILDYALGKTNGLDVLPVLRRIDERVPIVMLTGYASVELAVNAVKLGAEHVLEKPIEMGTLLLIIRRTLEAYRDRRKQVAVSMIESRNELDPFTGVSSSIRRLSDEAHRLLDSHAAVLIQGETGTGKGVLAKWLHTHGPRGDEAFVDINCAGLSPELLESELFGHERGAFTGAATSKLGLLEIAHRGTAFLDEIGEIAPQLQPRLLKVVEEKRFRKVGDVRDHIVDVRIIAATNRDLAKVARSGAFRSDLYFRINTVALTVPPLRTRPEDIRLLANRIAANLGFPEIEFTDDAMSTMENYSWPGNVRELRNVIERALIFASDRRLLTCNDVRFEPNPESDEPVQLTLEEVERRHIARVMRDASGSVDVAATRLGISRSSLYQRLKRFKIAGDAGDDPKPPEN